MIRPLCRSAALLLTLAALASSAIGQEPPLPWGHGTHALRVILKDLHFEPLPSPEQCWDRPEGTLVIALGETWPLDHFPGGIRHFVEKGGALLIASDRERPLTRLLAPGCWEQSFSVMVREPHLIEREGNPANRYRGRLPECPMIWPENNDPSLFRQLHLGVATNRPSALSVWRASNGATLSVLARYPLGCGHAHGDAEGLPIFAAGREWGKGRVLVLADHSVFINDMMLQEDNDNIGFACNCMAWLRADDSRRDRVLLYEEGTINANFNVPVSPPPIPPPGPWINQLLQQVEEENLFNRALLGQVSVSEILRAVLVALSVALLLYGLWRLVKARHRVESAALPLATAVQHLASPRPILQQRHKDMLRRNSLGEAARSLARECFEPLEGPAEMPPIQLAGGWWKRRRHERQLRRLWQLAFGEVPLKVSIQEFTRLLPEIEQVKAALVRGDVRIHGWSAGRAMAKQGLPSGV